MLCNAMLCNIYANFNFVVLGIFKFNSKFIPKSGASYCNQFNSIFYCLFQKFGNNPDRARQPFCSNFQAYLVTFQSCIFYSATIINYSPYNLYPTLVFNHLSFRLMGKIVLYSLESIF